MTIDLRTTVLVVLGLVGLALPLVLTSYGREVAIACIIMAIFAVGLSIVVGHAGLPSMGHAAFFGVAAYTVALTNRIGVPVALGAFLGIALATVMGMLVAPVILRTRGVYFLMATVAVGEILHNLAISMRTVTGGDDGISGIPRPVVLGANLADKRTMYYVALVVLLVVVWAVHLLMRSPFGESLRATRDNRKRWIVLGGNPAPIEWTAVVMSAFFVGIAGVLFVINNAFVSPGTLGVHLSGTALLMVVLGGASTMMGPVVGAFIVETIRRLGGATTERWMMVLGVVYIVVALGLHTRAWDAVTGALRRGGQHDGAGSIRPELQEVEP